MKVRVSDDVIARTIGGDIVLMDIASGSYFSLEGAGPAMWRELVEHGSIDRAVEALRLEFDADAAEIRRDLEQLVEQLRAKGLVSIVDDDRGPARR
jgi:hypothetical protein